MSKLITRRELPLMLAAPLMLQKMLMAQAAQGAQGAYPLPDLVFKLPKDMEIQDAGKTTGNTQVTLFGEPNVEGSLYGIHQKWYPHSNSRPHYHAHDRHILVLKGVWWVGTGPDYKDMEGTYPMPAGSYVRHVANELHYDGAKDEPCELYIVGIGPAASVQAGQQPGQGRGAGRGAAPGAAPGAGRGQTQD